MSISVPNLSALDPSALGTSTPGIPASAVPADIRNGNAAAKQAFQEGLTFEDMLVSQLSQELTDTVSSDGSDGLDGSDDDDGDDDDSSDGSSGMMGSDPASSTYAQMIPQVLTSSVMSAGGLGIAAQIAASIDPALRTPASTATTTSPGKAS